MFIDNNWYGNTFILSQYCRRPEKKIYGSIQHGLLLVSAFKLFNKQTKFGLRRFQSIPWFVWNSKIYDECKKNKIKNVFPIGSTFVYLDKLLNKKKFSKAKGTIVIPRKSDNERDYRINYSSMIKFLISKKHKKPFKVLVGKKDLNKLKKKKLKTFNSLLVEKEQINFLHINYINLLKSLMI